MGDGVVNGVEGAGEDLHKDILRPRARDRSLRDLIGGALLAEEQRLLGGGDGHVRGVAVATVDAWEVLGGAGGSILSSLYGARLDDCVGPCGWQIGYAR